MSELLLEENNSSHLHSNLNSEFSDSKDLSLSQSISQIEMKEKENRVSLPNQPMILAKDVYRQTFSPSLAYQGMLDLGSPSHNA